MSSWKDRSPADKRRLLEAARAREIVRCRESFEYFLFTYVKTQDPHTPRDPVKPFPKKDYLVYLARDLQDGPDMAYYAKSRQLMVSWILCAKTVWKMQFFAHSHCYFQSKKKEDAAEMIYDTVPQKARMSFIMVNLPEWLQICLVKKPDNTEEAVRYPIDQRTFTYGSVILPNGSHCLALAQGAAQIEGKVPAWYVSDEASLQEEWQSSQAAVVPCLSGGGRGRVVGTMRLPSDYGDEISTAGDVDPDGELRGVAKFLSKSGIPCIRIHYSADPDKDPATPQGKEWFAAETASMPGGYDGTHWQQHYEINPMSVSGQRCIPYFPEIKDRVVIDDIPYEQAAQWKLGGGADYGIRNPTVVLVTAVDFAGDFYVLDEIAAPGGDVGGVAGLSKMLKEHPLWHRINGSVQMDPTVWKQDQNNNGGLTSVAQLFSMHGVHFQPAKQRGQDADDLALNRLHEWWTGWDDKDFEPRLFICRRCKGLIDALQRIEFQDWAPAAQKNNDLKQKMRGGKGLDYFDAAKHWIVSLPSGPARMKADAPPMSWKWLQRLALKEAAPKNVRS